MGFLFDILRRTARFWSWANADHATYLFAVLVAVLGDPTTLFDASMWVCGLLLEGFVTVLVLYFLGRYVWPWLPPWVQRTLLWLWERFAPPDDAREGPKDSERITALEAEVKELNSRMDLSKNCGCGERDR